MSEEKRSGRGWGLSYTESQWTVLLTRLAPYDELSMKTNMYNFIHHQTMIANNEQETHREMR